MRFFVELVGHYPFHMVESSNGSREFQRDSFRKSHPSRGVRQFLQLFMDTQMFAGFIQDKELRKAGGRGERDVPVPVVTRGKSFKDVNNVSYKGLKVQLVVSWSQCPS